jgi:hypothetical protein
LPPKVEEVDVVPDEHYVADVVGRVDGAGGVGHDQGGDSQELHHSDGERALPQGVALVEVKAALHDHHGGGPDAAEEKAAVVAGDGAHGEVGDVLVVEDGAVCQKLRHDP